MYRWHYRLKFSLQKGLYSGHYSQNYIHYIFAYHSFTLYPPWILSLLPHPLRFTLQSIHTHPLSSTNHFIHRLAQHRQGFRAFYNPHPANPKMVQTLGSMDLQLTCMCVLVSNKMLLWTWIGSFAWCHPSFSISHTVPGKLVRSFAGLSKHLQ